jgi:WD40 repeat protein
LEGKLLRWNFETGEKQLLSANDDAVESLLWLSEEKMLVSGHRSGMLRFWNNFLKKPIFEIAPTNRWIRTLKELRFLNLIMLGTDSILTMPAVLDEIRNLNFGEVDNIASEIIPQAKEIILTANDSILRYPFSNIGLAGAVPIGALSSKIINDRTNVDSNDEMHFSGDNPWEKSEKVYTTAICTARNGKLTFIGCSNGSIFGFDFVLQKIVFASISKGEPITSICCNEVGSELVYVACRSIFGITIDIQARLVHSARVRIGYEFKKFPLLRFIGEQHILCDTVKCTHYSEKTEFVEWNESTELEIRDLPDLNKICNIQLPINLVYSVYSSHLNSIFAIEGDIRFASKSYSNISGEHDFKVGRFAPIKMRRYAVWRIRLSGSDENLSFTGVFEKLCTGHISPPLGISISDNNKFISVLSRDGNLSLWNSLNGKRMQEIQLKSNGLVGPVFTKSHELVCADNGQGNKTGPEIYQLIIH